MREPRTSIATKAHSLYARAEASVGSGVQLREVRAWLLHNARNRQTWCSVALAWCIGFASIARAEPRVQYVAPDACPPQAVFVERLRARLRVDVPASTWLRVTLATSGAGTRGSVEIERGATRTRRSIDGGRCEEVVEALALIAALALSEPDARDAPKKRARKVDRPAPGPGVSQRPPRPSESSTNAAPAAAESGASAPRDALAAAESGAGGRGVAAENGASAPRDALAAAESGASAPAAAENGLYDAPAAADSGTSAPSSPAPTSWHSGGRIGAAVTLFSGLTPDLQPGLQLEAAWDIRSGRLTLSAELGGRIARTERVTAQDGDARFAFVGGVLRLCGSRGLGATPWALSACAVAEPGVYSVAGENTLNQRSHSRLWLALGAAATASVRIAPWLSLRAGGELLAPVRRDRVLLAGETLYSIPPLGLRLHLGVEVPFG
jgi:hypothetical protein